MKLQVPLSGRLLMMLVGVFVFIPFHPALVLSAQADLAKRQFEEGARLFRQGNYDAASEALKKATQIQPRFAEAHHLLGVIYFNGRKQPAEAVEEIKKAIQINPKFSQAYYDLGLIY